MSKRRTNEVANGRTKRGHPKYPMLDGQQIEHPIETTVSEDRFNQVSNKAYLEPGRYLSKQWKQEVDCLKEEPMELPMG